QEQTPKVNTTSEAPSKQDDTERSRSYREKDCCCNQAISLRTGSLVKWRLFQHLSRTLWYSQDAGAITTKKPTPNSVKTARNVPVNVSRSTTTAVFPGDREMRCGRRVVPIPANADHK